MNSNHYGFLAWALLSRKWPLAESPASPLFRLRVPLGFSIREQIPRLRRGRIIHQTHQKCHHFKTSVWGVFTCWFDLRQGSQHPKNFWWPGGDPLLDPRVGPASWSWSAIPPSLPGNFQNRPTTPFKKFQMVPIFFFPETKAIWVSWGLCRDVKRTVHREKKPPFIP